MEQKLAIRQIWRIFLWRIFTLCKDLKVSMLTAVFLPRFICVIKFGLTLPLCRLTLSKRWETEYVFFSVALPQQLDSTVMPCARLAEEDKAGTEVFWWKEEGYLSPFQLHVPPTSLAPSRCGPPLTLCGATSTEANTGQQRGNAVYGKAVAAAPLPTVAARVVYLWFETAL